jgi:hypothetical protein
MSIEFDIIDPALELQVQHLAVKDPRLFEALTKKKRIVVSSPEDVVALTSKIAMLEARLKVLEDAI